MYNAENYIEECLGSVLDQTYKNLEIIIVDDNSTDKSPEIANTYSDRHSNITYVKVKNANAAKTRRDGIASAKGLLVCFVDSDDIVDADYVNNLYKTMEATGTNIAACSIETFLDDTPKKKPTSAATPRQIDSNAKSFADHYHMTNTNNLTLQTLPCKLFKKELFENIDYDVLVTNIFEDNFIMAQVLRKVERIGVIDEILYWYRQSSSGTSSGTIATSVEYEGVKLNSIEFFRDVVMEYCRKTLAGPNVDAAIDRLCATEFFNYARMVPDLITHNEYLEQKLRLEHARLEDRELQITTKEAQLVDRDEQIKKILNSRSYKIGHKVVKPTSKVVEVLRRSKK